MVRFGFPQDLPESLSNLPKKKIFALFESLQQHRSGNSRVYRAVQNDRPSPICDLLDSRI